MSARPAHYQPPPRPPEEASEGDPLMAINQLADELVKQGLRQVEGDLIGDDTRYVWSPYPAGWTTDDTIWDYGAPVSALTFNDSAQTFVLTQGTAVSGPVSLTIRPPIEFYTVMNLIETRGARGREVQVERPLGSWVLTLRGFLPAGDRAEKLQIAVHEPALFAARALELALASRGVVLTGDVAARHRLARHAVVGARGSRPGSTHIAAARGASPDS
jgi:serine-type D-Ala-D-Ala carboxypeptidase/endopeptidase (penicillin-binding protein 4)